MRTKWLTVAGTVLLWIVTFLAGASMIDAGTGKFRSAEGWQYWMVDVWGYPTWFRAFVGHSEYAGGVLIFLPRLAPYAAAYLTLIMTGAFVTVTTQRSDLSGFDPLFGIFLFTIVAAGRWKGRYRWRDRPAID